MGILDLIAQGGRPTKSLGDISLEKQRLATRQEELAITRRTAAATLGKIARDKETELLKRKKDKMREDIVAGSMQNAIGLGIPEAVGPLIMDAAAAAGDFELLTDVKKAYETAPATVQKPLSKIDKLFADKNKALASGDAARVQAIDTQIRGEEAKALSAKVVSEEKADMQAWEDLKNLFGFEKTYLGFGDDTKEPEGYFAMQERYKELLRTMSKKDATTKIQEEFEIKSKLGQDIVVPKEPTSNDTIDFDFTE